MSHFTRVKIRVRNREQLLRALQNLGHTVEEHTKVLSLIHISEPTRPY